MRAAQIVASVSSLLEYVPSAVLRAVVQLSADDLRQAMLLDESPASFKASEQLLKEAAEVLALCEKLAAMRMPQAELDQLTEDLRRQREKQFNAGKKTSTGRN